MVGRVEELRIYDQLAALELPLYITSSVDSFLFEALKHRMGANARQRPADRTTGWQKATARLRPRRTRIRPPCRT